MDVADFYRTLFLRTKKEAVKLGLTGPEKMDAQVMAVAFACYVTDETLAGTTGDRLRLLGHANTESVRRLSTWGHPAERSAWRTSSKWPSSTCCSPPTIARGTGYCTTWTMMGPPTTRSWA